MSSRINIRHSFLSQAHLKNVTMDIVKQQKIREWTLLGLVGTMALVANLPRHLLDSIGIEAGLMMGVLGLMVVLALFLYVKFFFFLLYALLAIGANVPEKWAAGLGISQTPLLVALIVMVAMSLLNYRVRMLPSGLEPKKRKQNPEAMQVLLNAIERGNISYVRTVLSMDFDLDILDDQGMSPLMRAAKRGDPRIVEMLVKAGASTLLTGPSGKATDLALKNGFPAVMDYLNEIEGAEAEKSARMAVAQRRDDSVVAA